MTREDFLEKYWNFYLMLERKFVASLQYVELDERNYSTFSMEYVSQILNIGSEIEVVIKELLDIPQTERKNITDYIRGLETKYSDIFSRKIKVKKYEIAPFDGLDKEKPSDLFWWKAYNEVKHGRGINFENANLKNTITLLATLYLLEMYLLKKCITEEEPDIVDKETELFSIIDWQTKCLPINRTHMKLEGTTLHFNTP